MKKLVIILLLILPLTTFGAAFTEDFESWNSNEWGTFNDSNPDIILPLVSTQYVDPFDNTTYYPHGGSYFGIQELYYGTYYPSAKLVFGTPAQEGTLIAYVKPVHFGANYLFSMRALGNWTDYISVTNGKSNPDDNTTTGTELMIRMSDLYGTITDYFPGVEITPGVWHQVKIICRVPGNGGSRVYWDGVLVKSGITQLSAGLRGIAFGTSTGSALCFYDDIQFLPVGQDAFRVTGNVTVADNATGLDNLKVNVQFKQGTDVQTYRAALDASGNFTISDVPFSDNYTVAIKAYNTLQVVHPGIALLDNVTLPATTLTCSQDLDDDNTITSSDLALILIHMDTAGDL